MTARTMLVDDHALIRDGLRRILDREDDVEIVAEASHAAMALAVEEQSRPDVVLVDINLEGGTEGIALVRKLRQRRPDLGLVVLTMYDDDDLVIQALHAGASAYALKSRTTAHILLALRHAVASPHSFSAEGLAQILARTSERTHKQPLLSDREVDVLRELASGAPVATIARSLFVSTSTLKTHVSRIYEKLNARTRTEAVMAGVRLGLLEVVPA
jgi:DNA-binding NarL/FixJ family response regulator